MHFPDNTERNEQRLERELAATPRNNSKQRARRNNTLNELTPDACRAIMVAAIISTIRVSNISTLMNVHCTLPPSACAV